MIRRLLDRLLRRPDAYETLRRERARLARELAEAAQEGARLKVERAALATAALEALILVDRERRIRYAGPAARELFGENTFYARTGANRHKCRRMDNSVRRREYARARAASRRAFFYCKRNSAHYPPL